MQYGLVFRAGLLSTIMTEIVAYPGNTASCSSCRALVDL